MFLDNPLKKIKLAKHQSPMKSLLHLMKSYPAPTSPPGQSRTCRRERSQEKQCSIPVTFKMAEWNVDSLVNPACMHLSQIAIQSRSSLVKVSGG